MRSKRVKTKIFAVSGILCFVALVAGTSPAVVSRAEGDPILSEIARYKTWDRVNTVPIAVPLQKSETDNPGAFIVGKEGSIWNVSDLGGG
ncbi:MAG TPA: hypothetical protein PKC89_05075 [Pyrinomonadaceae bacterium]|nr:hypothetical protein [Pyrinomonadaceae bacterium]